VIPMTGKARGRLRISVGAGEGYEITSEVAARHSGKPIRDALIDIIQDEVHDPELRQILLEPRLALELYGQDEDGEPQEVPLSPTEQWDRILGQLEKADVEVGIARSHAGGGRRRHGHSDIEARFPRQQVVVHPADYQLTDQDRTNVRNGQAVFFAGGALAGVQSICSELDGREALWYFAAPAEDPLVIREVIIPEQTVSGAHCRADGSDVLKAAREARKRLLRIVAAGHSHGYLGVFSSGTDFEQMVELARERVGKISLITKTTAGQVQQVPCGNGGAAFKVDFLDDPATAVKIIADNREGRGIQHGDLRVELVQTLQVNTSWFSTHNRRGHHMVPMLAVTSCPHCGSRTELRVDPARVVVHIVGQIDLSKAAEAVLRQEVRDKVKTYSWWGDDCGEGDVDREYDGSTADETEAATSPILEVQTCAGREPAPLEVYRRGILIATVPAGTLERAAAETPSLAAALGWDAANGQSKQQEEPAHG
jgi:hypothetical protein